jgi:hypothetical protein
MSVALDIRNAVVTSLRSAAVAGVPISRVYVDIADGLAKQNRPAIVVEMGDDSIDRREYGRQLRNLSIRLRIIADGSDSYATADPITSAANNRILTSSAIADLVDSLEHGGISRQQSDQGGLAMVTITFFARYWVNTHDL